MTPDIQNSFGIKLQKEPISKPYVDPFGFDKKNKFVKQVDKDPYPVRSVKNSLILELLKKYRLGSKTSESAFPDELLWGDRDEVGSINLDISPLGSQKIIIHRRLKDLKGNLVWVCKKVYPENKTEEEVGEITEDKIALTILKDLNDIHAEKLDVAKERYDNLKNLITKTTRECNKVTPKWFVLQGTRKLNDNSYLIIYNITGTGTGSHNSYRIDEFLININFNPENGLIRCWGNEVSSPLVREYNLMPSEWDEVFMPTQSLSEISDCIAAALSTY